MSDPPPRIYLTGPMGCGKSTVGRILAERLRWDFVDLDAAIEERVGMSIPAIFESSGEQAFRAMERRALEETAQTTDCVVATGGGALVQPGAMTWARQHGTVAYLQVPVDELVRRLRSNAESRPLLSGDDPGNPAPDMAHVVEKLLKKRRSSYEQADLLVRADRAPVRVAAEIMTLTGITTAED